MLGSALQISLDTFPFPDPKTMDTSEAASEPDCSVIDAVSQLESNLNQLVTACRELTKDLETFTEDQKFRPAGAAGWWLHRFREAKKEFEQYVEDYEPLDEDNLGGEWEVTTMRKLQDMAEEILEKISLVCGQMEQYVDAAGEEDDEEGDDGMSGDVESDAISSSDEEDYEEEVKLPVRGRGH